nr:hypothetical protein [Tanacetum cinerariifolium]
MTIFNGICDNCIYENGKPIICTACGSMIKGGLCLTCDFKEKNLYNCDPNAYSFDNSDYFPRPQYKNHLCNLCGNNSHDGYDCQQQFPFVYEQELSYNQNYDESFDPSNEIAVSNSNQEKEEPSQESDVHQLIEECSTEASEKQSMEDTMLELVKICQEKEFLCIHDDIDDLIESALNSKLLLINLNSQRLDKKEQEVKIDTSQISSIHEIAPIQSTKEPEHLLNEINSDKLDPHCFNVESDFVESLLNRDTFIDYSSKFDFSGELAHVNPEIPKFDFDFEEEIHLIENFLYNNSFPRPPEELNAEIADTIVESIPLLPILVQDGNSQPEEINIVTETDDVLPPKLLIDNSILSHESFDSNFEDNPSIPRPPPEPADVETNAGEEILVVMNDKDKFDENEDYHFFMFDKKFSLLSAESEDTIFDT